MTDQQRRKIKVMSTTDFDQFHGICQLSFALKLNANGYCNLSIKIG